MCVMFPFLTSSVHNETKNSQQLTELTEAGNKVSEGATGAVKHVVPQKSLVGPRLSASTGRIHLGAGGR